MTLCYIAIGSNLTEPLQQASAARRALAEHPQLELVAVSSLYRSKPMGPQDQPDYLNAVVSVETSLSPLELLDVTQHIEQQQGRQRKAERWGARTLDLDLLLFGDQIIQEPRLTIPHYGMKQREFVLLPLQEISPNAQFPDGSHIQHWVSQIKMNDLIIFKSPEQWHHSAISSNTSGTSNG